MLGGCADEVDQGLRTERGKRCSVCLRERGWRCPARLVTCCVLGPAFTNLPHRYGTVAGADRVADRVAECAHFYNVQRAWGVFLRTEPSPRATVVRVGHKCCVLLPRDMLVDAFPSLRGTGSRAQSPARGGHLERRPGDA